MMESFLSSSNDSKGAFDVVLNGGSPWGFTLQGGSEFRSKLVVSKVRLTNVSNKIVEITPTKMQHER